MMKAWTFGLALGLAACTSETTTVTMRTKIVGVQGEGEPCRLDTDPGYSSSEHAPSDFCVDGLECKATDPTSSSPSQCIDPNKEYIACRVFPTSCNCSEDYSGGPKEFAERCGPDTFTSKQAVCCRLGKTCYCQDTGEMPSSCSKLSTPVERCR